MPRGIEPPPTAHDDPGLAQTQAVPGGGAPTLARSASVPRADATAHSAETVDAYAVVTGESPDEVVHADLSASFDGADAARYEAGPMLGVGGMGEVTLQLDRRIGRQVAKKLLRRDVASPRALARFVREGRVQGQLEHPSVVPVYDLGADAEGRVYFTMKRVRGQTLAHILERLVLLDPHYTARFSRRRLLSAFTQVCLAVEYAHTRGVLHRDLKPSNLMMGDFGEVYVLDWGLAKLTSDAVDAIADHLPAGSDVSQSTPEVTRAGDVLGTPLYMAPEQLSPRGELDVRADVFALGAILFEILTLESYRTADSMPKIFAQAMLPDVHRPSERAKDVPPELDEVCARALATDPAHRLASAAELAEAVERYLEGDRDLEARKATASRLLSSARETLGERGQDDAVARVAAMRDALKALALSPDDEDAQKLLLSLVVDGSGKLPPEAEEEFAADDARLRTQGTRLGITGYVSWLLSWPLALWVGVRDWRIPAALTVLTLACIGYAVYLLRVGARSTRHSIALGMLSAAVVALSSGWLGPFVLVPIAACATAIMFIVHCTREERPWLIGIWGVAAAAPFGAELLGIFPPAYTFRGGEIVLHPRMLELPEGPTLAALAYTTVTFLILLLIFVGRLRDRQREGERRLFVQAWHLRQLFPSR